MSKKPVVGFLGPQAYMEKAFPELEKKFEIHRLHPKGWEKEEIDKCVAECKAKGIEAVGGFAQKDAFHHILINDALGNKTIQRLAFLYCMNKYLMRKLETKPFWFDFVDPDKETDEEIVAKIKEWPFMLKNTSLSLGRGIFRTKTPEELVATLKEYRADKALQDEINYQNKKIMEGIDPKVLPPNIPPFIAEHMVDMMKLTEYCYEGYVTAEGKIVHYGFTEEVYFANHQGLGYMTPPLNFPAKKAHLVEAYVDDYMGKLAKLGYLNQFFNIECWIGPEDEIYLTEINPRAAHSYHYNYLHCFGCSLFGDNWELARDGTEPKTTPWQRWKEGHVDEYTLIILITGKETGKVSEILDYEYIDHLENKENILVRHCKKKGDTITEVTAAGVMLLQIWITGKTAQDTINKEIEVRSKIYKHDQGDPGYPAWWTKK
jgi:hypothetical protein